MPLTKRLRRWIVQAALFAVTFLAVAPTISHWVAATTRMAWVEVCTTAGVKRVAVQAGEAPAPADPHGAGTHCPFCRLQGDQPLDLAPQLALLAVPDLAHIAPDAPYAPPPRAARPWAPSLSRAPPPLS